MSKCLSDLSVEHMILERGEIANSWKFERWDSLKLLTPNWQARLPGYSYQGDNPDGYMDMTEVINFIESYAQFIDATVHLNTAVTSVSMEEGEYKVITNNQTWLAKTLVVASGACNRAQVPALANNVPDGVQNFTAMDYRNPGQLPEGGVMVVGASATGVQFAEEIQESGRQVAISVGEHVRLPRVYRGKDIQWWLDTTGILDERYDEIDDIVRGRNIPSPQLVGSDQRYTIDLNKLTSIGVQLRGRLAGIDDGKLQFSGGLKNNCALADLKMGRLLNTIDEWVSEHDLDDQIEPGERYDATVVDESPVLIMDFEKSGIKSMVWATGYYPDYSWLDLPVLDRKGKIRHEGGVVDSPGMYLLGMSVLRRRKSSFIHGAEDDAQDLSAHLAGYIGR